jgi:hypothetical protein
MGVELTEWNLRHKSQASATSPAFPVLFRQVPISVVTCFLLTTRSEQEPIGYGPAQQTNDNNQTRLTIKLFFGY